MTKRAIEILYFDGCPSVDTTLDRVRAAMSAEGDGFTLQLVRVETEEQAKAVRFLGSPSVRVDGIDIEPAARTRTDFGLQCRVYESAGKLEGAPPVDPLRLALGLAPAAADTSGPAPHQECCGTKKP